MADKITFDRNAMGILEKKQWQDAESLGRIGASTKRISADQVAEPLPGPGGPGPQDLISAVKDFNEAMSMVIYEYSDAASNLGSATASASANFDDTEGYNRERAAQLGVEWDK